MQDRTKTKHRASVIRWLTVGVASYSAWFVIFFLLIIFFPFFLIISIFDKKVGYRRLKKLAVGFMRWFFLGYLRLIRLYQFAEIPSLEQSSENNPCVYVANHRSGLDAILAFSYFSHICVPVKSSYLSLPLLGLIIRWIGCIPFDRKNPQSIIDGVQTAKKVLRKGKSLFIFPEGTRTSADGTTSFANVFFKVAIEMNVPIVPVIIHSDVPFLAEGNGTMLTSRRATWRIIVEKPLSRDRRDSPADLGREARKVISKKLVSLDIIMDETLEKEDF